MNLNQSDHQHNLLDRMLNLVFHSFGSSLVVNVVNRCVASQLPIDSHHPPLVITISNKAVTGVVRPNGTDAVRELNYPKIGLVYLKRIM